MYSVYLNYILMILFEMTYYNVPYLKKHQGINDVFKYEDPPSQRLGPKRRLYRGGLGSLIVGMKQCLKIL